jgi:hypothetical protein
VAVGLADQQPAAAQSAIDDWPSYFIPGSELSALTSDPNPTAYSHLPNSGNFNHALALSDTVQFQGNYRPLSNEVAISTVGSGQWQGAVAAPAFPAPTGDPVLLAANNPAWDTPGTELMFEGYHQSPLNLVQDLNNTGVGLVPPAIVHSTEMPRMPLDGAIPIPPSRRSGAQPKTRYYCNVSGCNVSVARPSDLPRHISWHSASQRKCQFCSKEICNRPDKIKSHLEKYHKFSPAFLHSHQDLWK